MRTRTKIAVMGVAALLAGAGMGLYFTMGWLAAPYQETDAFWRIRGICTNSKNATPIVGAQITASFREPIRFKNHWRDPPPLSTSNVVTKTDSEGRFEVTGQGGSVNVKAQAEGYRESEPWENWNYSARNGIARVVTNIVLNLEPSKTNQ